MKPFAEGGVQRGVLVSRGLARLFDKVLVGAECDSLHETGVFGLANMRERQLGLLHCSDSRYETVAHKLLLVHRKIATQGRPA